MADLPSSAYAADERTRELCATDDDLAALRTALRRAEVVCHRAGWGQSSSFGPIESIEPYGYRLPHWPDIMYLLNRRGDPVTALEALTKHPCDVALIVDKPRYPQFRGLYFMAEAWHVTVPKDAPLADQKYDLAMAADHTLSKHPRRVQSRALYAATTDGGIWHVIRPRGGKPVCILDRVLEGQDVIDGRVTDALLQLTSDLRTLF